MIFAQYDLSTGEITGTCTSKVDDADLLAQGRAQIESDDQVNGLNYTIDLQTLQAIPL